MGENVTAYDVQELRLDDLIVSFGLKSINMIFLDKITNY